MRSEFFIAGDPMGWQRTGLNRKTGAIFTKDRTRSWETRLAYAVSEQMRERGLERIGPGVPITLAMTFYRDVTKGLMSSKPKAQRTIAGIMAGTLKPTTKPDYDNLAKCHDALNGVLWHDDAQITDAVLAKRYVLPGHSTGVRIVVETP